MRSTKKNLLNLIITELKDRNEIFLSDELRHLIEVGRLSRYKDLAHVSKVELYEEFTTEKMVNKAPATKKNYRSVILNGFLEYLYPNIKRENVFLYLGSKEGWAPVTKNRNYRFIRNFLKFLHEKGYIMKDLAKLIEVPKKVKKEQYVPNDEDIKKFFSVMPKIYKNKNDLLRYQTLFKFYIKTGLRRDEPLNIEIKDINFIRERIHLKKTKNKDEDYINMDQELTDLLKIYIKELGLIDGPLMIGKGGRAIERSVIYKVFHRIREEAGLPKGFTIHGFRRYFADKSRREGVDIHVLKEMMRHKDINTTNGYVDVKTEEKRVALSKIRVNF